MEPEKDFYVIMRNETFFGKRYETRIEAEKYAMHLTLEYGGGFYILHAVSGCKIPEVVLYKLELEIEPDSKDIIQSLTGRK
jgi:hypothetical protein